MPRPQPWVAEALDIQVRPTQPAAEKPVELVARLRQVIAVHMAQVRILRFQIHQVVEAVDERAHAPSAAEACIRRLGCSVRWRVVRHRPPLLGATHGTQFTEEARLVRAEPGELLLDRRALGLHPAPERTALGCRPRAQIEQRRQRREPLDAMTVRLQLWPPGLRPERNRDFARQAPLASHMGSHRQLSDASRHRSTDAHQQRLLEGISRIPVRQVEHQVAARESPQHGGWRALGRRSLQACGLGFGQCNVLRQAGAEPQRQ